MPLLSVDFALNLTLYLAPFSSFKPSCFNWIFQSAVPGFVILNLYKVPSLVISALPSPHAKALNKVIRLSLTGAGSSSGNSDSSASSSTMLSMRTKCFVVIGSPKAPIEILKITLSSVAWSILNTVWNVCHSGVMSIFCGLEYGVQSLSAEPSLWSAYIIFLLISDLASSLIL